MQANACCESKQTTICENRGRRSHSLPELYSFRPIIAICFRYRRSYPLFSGGGHPHTHCPAIHPRSSSPSPRLPRGHQRSIRWCCYAYGTFLRCMARCRCRLKRPLPCLLPGRCRCRYRRWQCRNLPRRMLLRGLPSLHMPGSHSFRWNWFRSR